MKQCLIREVAVVVAHPDDETIWVGGTLLMERDWNCRILGLCRAGDSDRAPKFQKAIASFNAAGELRDSDEAREVLRAAAAGNAPGDQPMGGKPQL